MKALVTGATGFLGSHLTDHLIGRGFEVSCLVRERSDLRWIEANHVKLIQGDLLDETSLRLAANGAEFVFHLAAVHRGRHSIEKFRQINEHGTANLLRACLTSSVQVTNFVYISSISAVGPRTAVEAVNEESPCRPIDPYGKSKLAAERHVFSFRDRLPVTIILPCLVYGPRDRNLQTVLGKMKVVNRGYYFTRRSNNSRFNCIHAKDLARGIVLAAGQSNSIGRRFFMCNPAPTTYDEVASITAAALGKRPLKIVVPPSLLAIRRALQEFASGQGKTSIRAISKAMRQPTLHWVCDGSRAEKELGFSPQISLTEGITQTARWYRQRGWI